MRKIHLGMPEQGHIKQGPIKQAAPIVAVVLAAGNLANRLLGQLLQGLVRLYQLTLSPFIGNQCRFHPTCSHYAMEALQRHGPWRGSWLAATRLGRCHPFSAGGLDPVPNTTSTHQQADNQFRQPVQSHVEEAL